MGNNTATDLRNLRDEGLVSLRQAVAVNLQSNHYPPIPDEYVDPTIAAIEAWNGGEAESLIDIENVRQTGMVPRKAEEGEDGRLRIPVADLLQITHSWAFTDWEDGIGEGDED